MRDLSKALIATAVAAAVGLACGLTEALVVGCVAGVAGVVLFSRAQRGLATSEASKQEAPVDPAPPPPEPAANEAETEPAAVSEPSDSVPVDAVQPAQTAAEPEHAAQTTPLPPEQEAAQEPDPMPEPGLVPEPKAAPTPQATQGQGESSELLDDSHKDEEKPSHTFSFDSFARSMFFADDPWNELREIVGEIRTREAEKGPDSLLPVEQYLARSLDEAGLFDEGENGDEALPPARVVRPHRSGMFYIRTAPSSHSYGAHLRVLRIEAVLNALLFAHERLGDLTNAGTEGLYRTSQRLLASVCAQAPVVDMADWSYLAMPWQGPVGPSQHGEWAMRHELSEAIESVRVPFRLEAEFRTNVASGDVALEVLATPFRAFPSSAYVAGLGVVPTTTEMRRREASKYAARIGLLLSAHAFKGSERIRRVWVSSVLETPTRRTCLFSGCVDRKTFCRLSLDRQTDPIATLRRLGVSLLEENGILKATDPTFYLEDPRFCPPMRHDLWRFSERALPASAAISLGASRVSGLVIHEELPRMLAADAILRNIADPSDRDATQRTVHAIMEVAGQTSDLTVWGAAERVVARLVDGTLGLDDLDGIRSEFVSGDVLTRKVESAERLIAHQRPQDALEVLLGVLQPIERAGSYDDSDAVAYRCFESFAERVIYNRLNAQDKRSVILAPDAYPMAHMLASALLASLSAQEQDGGSHAEQAVAHARRAVEVAPLSTAAKLGLAACLEQTGDVQAAQDQIVELLESAYHPQAIGYAYYRMASVQWELGNDEACQACYLRSIRMEPTLLPLVIAKCQALMAQGATFVEQMDEDAVIEVLNKNGIPLAPTARTSYLLYDGATASVDAEVFPVARELMQVMESLTGDDVIRGIRKSLEREPDA